MIFMEVLVVVGIIEIVHRFNFDIEFFSYNI